MKIRRLIPTATTFTIALMSILSGCNSNIDKKEEVTSIHNSESEKISVEQETDKSTEEKSTEQKPKEESATEKPLTEKTPIDEALDRDLIVYHDILNNGSNVVAYSGGRFYWKYNNTSFEKQGLLQGYELIHTAENQLVYRDFDDNEHILLTTTGSGKLYVYQEEIYFEKHLPQGETVICLIEKVRDEWDIENIKQLFKGKLIASDDIRELLIMMNNETGKYVLVDVVTGEERELPIKGTILKYEKDRIYYQDLVIDHENNDNSSLNLYVMDMYDNITQLARITPDMYEFENYFDVNIQCMQVLDGYVYYSYGGYAGTGNFYQGGDICRVSLDGKNNEVLVTDVAEDFYVYDDNGTVKMVYREDSNDYSHMYSKELNVDTKEISDSSKNYGCMDEPMYKSDGSYWIYRGTIGKSEKLLDKTEYNPDNSSGVTVRDIEIVGYDLFYTVVYSEYNEELSMGWRDGYEWIKTEVYCKDLAKGGIELVYKYEK